MAAWSSLCLEKLITVSWLGWIKDKTRIINTAGPEVGRSLHLVVAEAFRSRFEVGHNHLVVDHNHLAVVHSLPAAVVHSHLADHILVGQEEPGHIRPVAVVRIQLADRMLAGPGEAGRIHLAAGHILPAGKERRKLLAVGQLAFFRPLYLVKDQCCLVEALGATNLASFSHPYSVSIHLPRPHNLQSISSVASQTGDPLLDVQSMNPPIPGSESRLARNCRALRSLPT